MKLLILLCLIQLMFFPVLHYANFKRMLVECWNTYKDPVNDVACQMSENYRSPPWNFYWVTKNELAGMASPQSIENIRYLFDQGIRHLVTLSPEKRPPINEFPGIEWTEIPIPEFEAPTLDQIREFVDICERHLQQHQAVGVHCRQGRGRTGVMAACFLVRFQDLSPGTAINDIRLKRPGSIETPEQARIVARYHDYIRGL